MNNGLCRNATSTPRTNFYWRGGCTDPTFQDPACPNYCNRKSIDSRYYRYTTLNAPLVKNPWEDQLIWQCDATNWCCNNGGAAPENQRYDRTNLTCCTISQYTFSAASPSLIATATYLGEVFTVGETASTSTTAASSSGTPLTTVSMAHDTSLSTPASQSIQTASSSAASSSTPSGSGTSSAAIGAGVGVGVAAALALCGLGFWMWRRKKARKQAEVATRYTPPAELGAPEHRTEAPVEKYRAELMSNAEPHELSGDTPGIVRK